MMGISCWAPFPDRIFSRIQSAAPHVFSEPACSRYHQSSKFQDRSIARLCKELFSLLRSPLRLHQTECQSRRVVGGIPALILRAHQKTVKGPVLGRCIGSGVSHMDLASESTGAHNSNAETSANNSLPAGTLQTARADTSNPTIRQPSANHLSPFAVFAISVSTAIALTLPNPSQALLVRNDAIETRSLVWLQPADYVAWQRGAHSQPAYKSGAETKASRLDLPQVVESEGFGAKQPASADLLEFQQEKVLQKESVTQGGAAGAALRTAVLDGLREPGLVGVAAGLVGGFVLGALSTGNKQSPKVIPQTQPCGLGRSPQLELPISTNKKLVEAKGLELEGSCASPESMIDSSSEEYSLPSSYAHSDTDDGISRSDNEQDDMALAENGNGSHSRAWDDVPEYELDRELISGDPPAESCEPLGRPFPFECTSEPETVNVVLDNRTDRKVVLFADDARPDAQDTVRTAWKVFYGPSPPQLIQLRPNNVEVGARRLEGRHLVLRSGPFVAKPRSTGTMLQPAHHHTPWLRGTSAEHDVSSAKGRPDDDWAETGSEDVITLLNLRQTPRAADDLELFLDGELCAVHRAVKKGPAVYFQAPKVLSFAVPRLGVDIYQGDAFDRVGDLEEAVVDLESPLLEGKKLVFWIGVTYDAEFNVCWQQDVLEIEGAPSVAYK